MFLSLGLDLNSRLLGHSATSANTLGEKIALPDPCEKLFVTVAKLLSVAEKTDILSERISLNLVATKSAENDKNQYQVKSRDWARGWICGMAP